MKFVPKCCVGSTDLLSLSSDSKGCKLKPSSSCSCNLYSEESESSPIPIPCGSNEKDGLDERSSDESGIQLREPISVEYLEEHWHNGEKNAMKTMLTINTFFLEHARVILFIN
jgi:hypothetical protein